MKNKARSHSVNKKGVLKFYKKLYKLFIALESMI